MRDRNTIIQQTVIYQEAPPEEAGTLRILLSVLGGTFGLVAMALVGVGWLLYKLVELTAKAILATTQAIAQILPIIAGIGAVAGLGVLALTNLQAILQLTKTLGLVALGLVASGLIIWLSLEIVKVARAKLEERKKAKEQTAIQVSSVRSLETIQPIIIVVRSDEELERVRGLLDTVPIQRAGLAFGTQPIQSTETARVEYHG